MMMNNKTGKGVKFEEEEEQQQQQQEGEIEKLLLGIMDGYEDSAIPSLEKISPSSKVNNYYFPGCSRKRERVMVSAAAMTRTTTDNNNNGGVGGGGGGGVMHKERSRRENMAEKYSLLRSLVPTLTSMTKVSRAEIVNEATNYIKTLEEENKKLEDQKTCILQQQQQRIGTPPGLLSQCMNMNLKPSVNVCVCNGGIAVFGIHLLVKRGLLIKIFDVFEKYETEVLGATINGYGQLTFTCKFNNSGCNNQTDIVIENIKKDILNL